MRHVISELHVHRIILAPATLDTGEVAELIRVAKAVGVRVSVLPRMFEAVGAAVEFDDVDGLTMLGVRRFGLVRSSTLLKRAFDLAAASIGAAARRPADGSRSRSRSGSTREVRSSSGSRAWAATDGIFHIFKYRSMVVDADEQKDRLRALNEAGAGLFKIADDPRVTRVGRLPAPHLARRAAPAASTCCAAR